jgi:hypothetical protein
MHHPPINPTCRLLLAAFIATPLVLGACQTARDPSAPVPRQTTASSTTSAAGDVFPIMTWEQPPRNEMFSDPHGGLSSLAESGFTVAGFVRPEQLKECERLGLRAIVSRPAGRIQWGKLTDEQIDTTIRKLVESAGDSPAVIGYFIEDEPNVREFPALAKAAAAVRKYAPGKMPYVNLYPDYATIGSPDLSQLGTANYAEYLERFITEVKPDVVSWDNYRVQVSLDLKDPAKFASYYNNLLTVRRVAAAHGLPFWQIVSGNRIRPFTPVPSPANLAFQAYTTLAAGGRGVTWYTYYTGGYAYAAVDKQGRRGPTWSYLRMVNEQVKTLGPTLLKLRSTGVYFTSPAPVENLPALPGKLVTSVECATPVMVGEFDGPEGQTWVMLVNLSLRESAKPKVTWAGAGAAPQVMSPSDASMAPMDADNTIWLPAGQGALIRVK